MELLGAQIPKSVMHNLMQQESMIKHYGEYVYSQVSIIHPKCIIEAHLINFNSINITIYFTINKLTGTIRSKQLNAPCRIGYPECALGLTCNPHKPHSPYGNCTSGML